MARLTTTGLGKRRVPLAKGANKREKLSSRPAAALGPIGGAVAVERLAHDGRGVARDAHGKTLFIDGALPGERVEIAIHRQRRRFDEAHVRERLTDAPERVVPPCEYAERCGGCDLQHLAVEAQREHKRRVLVELLRRQSIEVPHAPSLLAGDEGGYRRRARLGVKCDGEGRVHLGFRARGSEQLVDIARCHVLVPRLSALLPALRVQLEALAVPRHVGHLELLATDGERPVVVVRQLRDVPEDAARWREFAARENVALALLRGRETITLDWLSDVPRLTTQVAGSAGAVTLGLAPGDFLQANAEINQRLIDTARDWLALGGSERLLDLFAGIGNFSLALAADVASVTAVEGSNAMVERLRDNARRNECHEVTALQADLSAPGEAIDALLAEHDTVLLDPPRGGADALCRRLAASSSGRVLYVSCDPASLARDAGHLLAGGFRLERLAVADMFVHTAHLESLALFTRPRRRRAGEGADGLSSVATGGKR